MRERVRLERLEHRLLFAAGDLDPTFGGGDGVATFDSFATTRALAVAADGSIVVAGMTGPHPGGGNSLIVARYRPDGTPDPTFGNSGQTFVSDVAAIGASNLLGIASDGRIVVVLDGPRLLGFDADGSLDTDFGDGGLAHADFGDPAVATALEFLDGGKVLVGVRVLTPGAEPRDASARFNADGSNDPSYGPGGTAPVAVAADDGGLGRIGPYDFHVPDELAVGPVKAARVQWPAIVAARQPDGKIVALDHAADLNRPILYDVAVLRFNADGTVDPTFAHAAHARNSLGLHSIAFQPGTDPGTGRILYGAGGQLAVIGLQSAPPLESPRPVPAPDTTPPTATLVVPPVVTAATTAGTEFAVRFADETALEPSSLGGGDVRVTAPDGTSAIAQPVGGPAASGPNEYSVTYRYTPSGGGFTAPLNGTYAISVEPNQVLDAAGNAMAASALGSFTVNIPADAPNLTVGDVTLRHRGRTPGALVAGARPRGAALVRLTNSGGRVFAGWVGVRVLASADATADAADIVLVEAVRPLVIRRGSSRGVRLPLRMMPAALVAGGYYLVAEVDTANAVAETSEVDNMNRPMVPVLRILPSLPSARGRRVSMLFADEAPILEN